MLIKKIDAIAAKSGYGNFYQMKMKSNKNQIK